MAVILNIDRMCRTCLCQRDDLSSIFNVDPQQNCKIFEMISVCSDMKIEKNDGLPDKICDKCVESARSAFAFRQQCDEAYRSLLEKCKFLTEDFGDARNELGRKHLANEINPTSYRTRSKVFAENHKNGMNILKSESFVNAEYSQATEAIATDENICFTSIDIPCKLEIFDDDECLTETFEEPVIKKEPETEHEANENTSREVNDDVHSNDSTGCPEEYNDADENKCQSEKQIPTKIIKASAGRHTCNYCDKSFGRGTHLRRHILTHTNEKNFKCKICERAFTRKDRLVIHEKTFHSQERPFACQLCEKSFKRSDQLRSHINTKHSEVTANKKQHVCDTCSKGFTTTKSLEVHKKAHLEKKIYKCKFCEEQFTDKEEHRHHMKQVHLQGKAFLCSECGQSFVRNDYLLIHMRRHKGIKPFKCKFCPKAFSRATDLKVHEKYHTNEKPHLCTICGKGFHRAYDLLVHSRTHNGLKPYQCVHCPKSFAQCNDLKAHIRRHTGERYKCDICDEGFIQYYQLNNHKRTVHNIDSATNARRVTKFLTPSAQKQQMLLQQYQQDLVQLVSQQRELEEHQQGRGIENEQHDSDLQKQILEARERIQDVQRELEEINGRLQEELEQQYAGHPDLQSAEDMVDVNDDDYNTDPSDGLYLRDNPTIPHNNDLIKIESSH